MLLQGAEGETSTGAAGGEKQQGAAAEPQEMAEAASVSGATARGEAEGTSATALPPPKPGFIKGSMAAEFNSILKALTLAETKSIDPTELFEVDCPPHLKLPSSLRLAA